MRVVDRKTFLSLPIGTLYAKIGDTTGDTSHYYFGEVRIKDGARGVDDWYSVGFTDGFTTARDSGEWADHMERLYNGGEATVDFETLDSDGLYDDGQLFAVFSSEEMDALIGRLKEARNAIATGSRRAKTPQAVECEAGQSGAESASPKPSQGDTE